MSIDLENRNSNIPRAYVPVKAVSESEISSQSSQEPTLSENVQVLSFENQQLHSLVHKQKETIHDLTYEVEALRHYVQQQELLIGDLSFRLKIVEAESNL
ncbi:hypothetical protein GEMRC1_013117 [Eukaryota sp. GEM-RC1]